MPVLPSIQRPDGSPSIHTHTAQPIQPGWVRLGSGQFSGFESRNYIRGGRFCEKMAQGAVCCNLAAAKTPPRRRCVSRTACSTGCSMFDWPGRYPSIHILAVWMGMDGYLDGPYAWAIHTHPWSPASQWRHNEARLGLHCKGKKHCERRPRRLLPLLPADDNAPAQRRRRVREQRDGDGRSFASPRWRGQVAAQRRSPGWSCCRCACPLPLQPRRRRGPLLAGLRADAVAARASGPRCVFGAHRPASDGRPTKNRVSQPPL